MTGLGWAGRIINWLSVPTLVSHVITWIAAPWQAWNLQSVLVYTRAVGAVALAVILVALWVRYRQTARRAMAAFAAALGALLLALVAAWLIASRIDRPLRAMALSALTALLGRYRLSCTTCAYFLIGFLMGLVLAVILNFFIFYCVALLSFWLTDVHLLFGTVSVVLVVVSGGVFPMDIFGKTAALLISLLPFGYTTQFPVNIINGKLSMGAIGTGMLCQLAWIAFFWGLGQMMWKKGLQRFAAVGG